MGAALALSGAILQGYFRNPLADPFILGVSSGASLGAVLSLELGLTWTVFGFSSQSWLAFLTSLLLVASVYLVSENRRLRQGESLLLTGIAAGAMASALTSFLLFDGQMPMSKRSSGYWAASLSPVGRKSGSSFPTFFWL